jgi:methylated-DNA-[protein]-cysteine S-methyltransferase
VEAIEAISAVLAGEPRDLTGIELDLSGVPDLHRQVYRGARAIPPGRMRTYGEIAGDLGDPGAARAVGQALGQNPVPVIVPCHRVVAAAGKAGGFSAPGGVATKLRLLAIERASPQGQPDLFSSRP